MGWKEFVKRRSLRARDHERTKAAELTIRESLYPIILVTILFFLWGFSYGLLDTLNKHFQNTLDITKSRSSGLQAAYFGAYPIASLGHAAWILRHYGYRATFIWGLCLYGIGALIAFPCIKAKSFGGFCAAIFIIGNGLGSLETAANPYITVCGPPRYAELRINFSQAFNGIGTVIAPVLGSYVLFTFDDQTALANVQWIYIAIAVFVFLLAIVFFLSVIPEITDADMAFQASETHANADHLPLWKQYRLFHAAFAQFCYTGAQVAIASYFINYVTETVSAAMFNKEEGSSLAAKYLAGAQAAFAIGRFAGVGLMKYVRPRWVFLTYLTMCIIFVAPSITQRGYTGMSMLYITLFFESICFPTIVALGMRGLGRHTKRGSGFLVGGVMGGAVVPPLLGVAADHHGTPLAMVVPMMFFVAAETYAIAVNFVPAYRDPADAFSTTEVGLQPHHSDEEKVRHDNLENKEGGGVGHGVDGNNVTVGDEKVK
ncbi:Glucose/galactose transporter [Apiospora rasikravindrae]|uniref:Glucose/galactose transporter n=1 Tax=Apiospora rasikravindrae TaxID=990691 RepID=A0ABR1SZ17_9PEZI